MKKENYSLVQIIIIIIIIIIMIIVITIINENTYFPEHFSLSLFHTALSFNAFFDENKDKRKWHSMKSVGSEGTKWKIQYLLKLKTHLVRFVFGLTYQISGKSKNKRFQSMVDLEPIRSVSTVL